MSKVSDAYKALYLRNAGSYGLDCKVPMHDISTLGMRVFHMCMHKILMNQKFLHLALRRKTTELLSVIFHVSEPFHYEPLAVVILGFSSGLSESWKLQILFWQK